MIARLSILLPFTLSVRQGDPLTPIEFDAPPLKVRIHPPCRAASDPQAADATSPVPALAVIEGLICADPQPTTDAVTIDGQSTVQANLLRVDLVGPDFDRRRTTHEGPEGDAVLGMLFSQANAFLARLRASVGATEVKQVSRKSCYWRMDFLTDEERPFPIDPTSTVVSRRWGTSFEWRLVGITSEVWDFVRGLPVDHGPSTWATLMLDAESFLPEIGASVVLASAALETLIAGALERLSKDSSIPSDLWSWIMDRKADFQKQPSVGEQYDVLLRALSTKSLKDDLRLWGVFRNLREARNTYVHEGIALIGGREVLLDDARRLIAGAKEIIDWVEALLPPDKRSPRYSRPLTFRVQKPVTPPNGAST
jgi:hypothetical protein